MIKTRDLVPGVYYNESRDFQVLGRTFEILFNYIKTNTDLMEGIPFSKNCDIHLLSLLATSLGFSNKRNYSKEELSTLCSSFIGLLRIKGTRTAIQQAINLMLHAHNINKIASVEQESDFNFNIYIPQELEDITILEDIFEYILPCGFTYNFINAELGEQFLGAMVTTKDRVAYRLFDNTINGNIGLIAKENNINTPSMPSEGNIEKTKNKTSMVSSGTIVVPENNNKEE